MACGLIISAGGETIWALIKKKKKCAEGARSALLLSVNLMIIMVPTQPHSEAAFPAVRGTQVGRKPTGRSWRPASRGRSALGGAGSEHRPRCPQMAVGTGGRTSRETSRRPVAEGSPGVGGLSVHLCKPL